MRYTAHLQAGGTIEVVVKDGFTPLNMNGQEGWVMDDNGCMVNMQYVVALVPVLDTLPRAFADSEGDTWTLVEGDWYRLDRLGDSPGALVAFEEIKSEYGFDHAIA